MPKEKEQKSRFARQRIFLVDDHPMVRERLVQLLEREADLQVCGQAEDAPQALQRIGETRPNLVIVDITLKQGNGLELIKSLVTLYPEIAVLVLTMHDESVFAERALRAGALGYLTKVEATETVLAAIRKLLKGEIYVSPALTSRIFRRSFIGRKQALATQSLIDTLSDREMEVFQLMGRGFNSRRIAEDLNVGLKSVEAYRTRIKEKLAISDSTELLFRAFQWANTGGH
jgi:DNA-binding NarL/FixJ family response regulator